MIPAMVPVPINRMETPITLDSPNSVNSISFLLFPVTSVHRIPPIGRAISGSMLIPAIGLRASRIITAIGP